MPPRRATLTVIGMLALVNSENVEALLVDGGRISVVGSERRVLSRRPKRVVDLGGAYTYPAFADRHAHLSILAIQATTLDLTSARSLEDVKAAIEGFKGDVVLGRGWDESRWGGEIPDRKFLDSVEDRRPVVLIREDGHVAALNTRALERYRPKGEVDPDTGLIYEETIGHVMKQIPLDRERGVRKALAMLVSEGVVEVHDMGMSLRWWSPLLRARPPIDVRVYFQTDWDSIPESVENVTVEGLKAFADGSIGAGNAAVSTGYTDGKVVKPFLTRSAINELAKKAESMGLRLAVHAIGDAAIRETVEGLKGHTGHRIEHFELVPEEYLDAPELLDHVKVCMQPNFLKWSHPGGLYEEKLGKIWASRNNPFALLHGRVHMTFGSDCMPLSPRFGIECVTEAPHSMQRLTLEDALSHYVRSPLSEGGEASFIITDGPLPRCRVLATFFRGTAVYRERKAENLDFNSA